MSVAKFNLIRNRNRYITQLFVVLSSVWQIGANSWGFINVIQIKTNKRQSPRRSLTLSIKLTSRIYECSVLCIHIIGRTYLHVKVIQTFQEFRFETADFLRHFNKCIIVRSSPILSISFYTCFIATLEKCFSS